MVGFEPTDKSASRSFPATGSSGALNHSATSLFFLGISEDIGSASRVERESRLYFSRASNTELRGRNLTRCNNIPFATLTRCYTGSKPVERAIKL